MVALLITLSYQQAGLCVTSSVANSKRRNCP